MCTCDLVILEITNPNHNQHLEIEIDKVLDSVVDLWFGTYWFEYYECHNEQEFIDSYLNTIKEAIHIFNESIPQATKDSNK